MGKKTQVYQNTRKFTKRPLGFLQTGQKLPRNPKKPRKPLNPKNPKTQKGLGPKIQKNFAAVDFKNSKTQEPQNAIGKCLLENASWKISGVFGSPGFWGPGFLIVAAVEMLLGECSLGECFLETASWKRLLGKCFLENAS